MPRLRAVFLPLAVVLSIFQPVPGLPVNLKEAYEAEAVVDRLSRKLHAKLLTMKDACDKAKENISEAIKELTILKNVQVLLGQLNNRREPEPMCEHGYILLDYRYKQSILIEARSALPVHYTITVQVNHKVLVDEKKATLDGQDLRVFYLADDKSLPVEIDRIVKKLYTTSTTVQFRTQRVILANAVDVDSYALVFGKRSTEKAKANPKNVFLFYEDFSNSTLTEWKRVWGEWTVKNGSLFGKTGRSPFGSGEVGLYLKEGKEWGDIEVELDLMETGTDQYYPSPFVRVQESDLRHTTAWWFQYGTKSKACITIWFSDNTYGSSSATCNQLPEPPANNRWFRFKYLLVGYKVSQWANGMFIKSTDMQQLARSEIPRGTIALGCHTIDSGNPSGCRTFYDNIKVRLVVESKPTVYPGDICHLAHYNDFPIGDKERPGDSCKQIHDANLVGREKSSAKSGVYWIRTGLTSKKSASTFCDMEHGGWTLIGKISGDAVNNYDRWLVENVNTELLKTPNVNSRNKPYACMDARRLAVGYASEIMLSSSKNTLGLGTKWIRWELPSGREHGTWWNHNIGQAKVEVAKPAK